MLQSNAPPAPSTASDSTLASSFYKSVLPQLRVNVLFRCVHPLVFSDGGKQRGGSDVGGAGVGLRQGLSTAAGLRGPAGGAPPAGSGRAVHQERHVAEQQPVREARRQTAGSFT